MNTIASKDMRELRSDPAPLLDIHKLSIAFDLQTQSVEAVTDVSFAIAPGETLGLVGESGCGKSTIALAIMQALGQNGRISAGEIRYNGRDLRDMSPAELRRLRGGDIAMIYQEPMASLNPAMRIEAQLMEVPMIHEGLSKSQARARAAEIVEDVRLPDPERILRSYPHQLSGGQQQRIVIAMALMARPALLILDEPTTALDVTVEASIMDLLGELGRKYNTAMLFITHNLGLVMQHCDRLCVMYSGQIVESGSPTRLFDACRHPYTEALLGAIPRPGSDKSQNPITSIPGQAPTLTARPQGCRFAPRCRYRQENRCDQTMPGLKELDAGQQHFSRCVRADEIDWNAPHEGKLQEPNAATGDVVLRTKGLSKYYALDSSNPFSNRPTLYVKANEQLSFEARAGQTLAIVGESGCGKSTLAKLLLGLETPTEGEIELWGKSVHQFKLDARDTETVADVQMVFQNPFDTLNPSMSVGAQIMRALEIFGYGKTQKDREKRLFELLDMVKLPRDFAKRMPRQLSGGQKQRIGIARAFAGDAQIVIADEPVSALDVSVQAAVTELLMDIQRKNSTSLLFISHDLSVVRYIADQVMVMYLGHIVEIGSTEQIFAPPYHPYTEALLSAVPRADPHRISERIALNGEIPSAVNVPSGCPFQTRCPMKAHVQAGRCESEKPALKTLSDGHQIMCHLSETILGQMKARF